MIKSRCGIVCDPKKCKEASGFDCAGCPNMDNPPWGECDVKNCSERRGHAHCGQCPDFSCKTLNEYAYDKDQGDDGKRIETCRMWANYENHGIGTCELTAEEIIAVLEKEKTHAFATCADNRVTVRTMSHVNEGLVIYFQTGEYYLKTQQIRANPNVAISVGLMDIEGVAEIIGHPKDNDFVLKKLGEKHPNAVERWSSLPNQVIVKIEIQMARQWRYVDNKPVIATFARK
jgi:general stress protein 26